MTTTITITTFYGYQEGPCDINPDIPLAIVKILRYPHWRSVMDNYLFLQERLYAR